MKIALMTNNYKPFIGGVPISIERLKNGLQSLGHQVTVFAPFYENQEEEEDVFRYSVSHKKYLKDIGFCNLFDKKIEEEFIQQKFDLIHVHHPILIGNMAVYLSKKYHIPLVFTYHTRYEEYLSHITCIHKMEKNAQKSRLWGKINRTGLDFLQKKLLPFYIKKFLKYCDFIFAPTKGIMDSLHLSYHIPYEKMEILPTGIEKEAYIVSQQEKDKIRQAYHIGDMPLFLSVSRISYEKNILFLLKSMEKVKLSYGKPFRFLLIGDGPKKAEYEILAKNLGLEKEVIFAGKMPNKEIAPYFAAADAFVFASKTETQGIVILEAFAGGTPVYALDATGVRDLVNDGVNGYLCEENETIFAEKLIAFLKGQENRHLLSENAFRTASCYHEEAVAEKAVHLYNNIIAHTNKTVNKISVQLFLYKACSMLPYKM